MEPIWYGYPVQFSYMEVYKMLSSSDTMKKLRVTQVTLYKWVNKKKMKAHKFKVGSKVYLGFDEAEVSRIQKKLPKKRKKGYPLF